VEHQIVCYNINSYELAYKWVVGLHGVVTSFAKKISDEFDSHTIHQQILSYLYSITFTKVQFSLGPPILSSTNKGEYDDSQG